MEYFLMFVIFFTFLTGMVTFMLARALKEMDDTDIDID